MIPVLETHALRVGYRRHVVLDDLALSLAAGELTCLLGRNGSGKSTLLRTLAGLQPPLAGQARLRGRDVVRMPPRERARLLAVVLTEPVDVGILRAADLVALGRYARTGWTGRLGADDQEAVDWALRATGAAALAARNVGELSDGERQRVLIARALAQQPMLLALDEPVAYVDVARRVELAHLLRAAARERGLAVLLTTHDLDLALRTADTIWLIDGGRVHVGAPEDLVLSGAVAGAFASDEVRFDLDRGAFVPRPRQRGRVAVSGAGAPALWAVRAMEREGLAVAARADIAVVAHGLGRWELRTPAGRSEHPSIGALLAAVRAALPADGTPPKVAEPVAAAHPARGLSREGA